MTASKFERARNPTMASDEVAGVHTPKVIVDGVVINPGDITIGAVEIRDGITGDQAHVSPTGLLSVDGSGVTQPVSAASLPLPAGASTAANQTSVISAIGNTNTAIGLLAKLTDTQPVSLVSVPLAAGAATAAKQDTGNTSLASIDTKLTAPLAVTNAGLSNLDVALSTRLKPADTLAKVSVIDTITNPVAVTIAASVAVTGPLTDTQLRASPVPVTGSFSASTAATATDQSPIYAEGAAANVSQDLAGRLRVRADSMEGELRRRAEYAALQQAAEISYTAMANERYAGRYGLQTYGSEQYPL